jgi:hypothetical protein
MRGLLDRVFPDVPALLLSWTMVIPEVQICFPTKVACEQVAAKWRAKFETEVKEGTSRTTERRRRLAPAGTIH